MNQMMTRRQAQAFGSYARDGVEGYAPANDAMSAAEYEQAARGWEAWAESRSGWAQAYDAARMAQRCRASARRMRRA